MDDQYGNGISRREVSQALQRKKIGQIPSPEGICPLPFQASVDSEPIVVFF
jgi:hypothetical protein